jgi:hypothetical protein
LGSQAYNAKNTKQIKLALNLKTDTDIIQYLATIPNMQGYIKSLIRTDIAKGDKTMNTYHIKPEYLPLWGSECTEDTIVTEDELQRLADEWEKPLDELLDQLIPN